MLYLMIQQLFNLGEDGSIFIEQSLLNGSLPKNSQMVNHDYKRIIVNVLEGSICSSDRGIDSNVVDGVVIGVSNRIKDGIRIVDHLPISI